MDKIYSSFNLASFKRAASVAWILGDFIIIIYIYLLFTNPELVTQYKEALLQVKNINPNDLSENFEMQFLNLFTNTLLTLLSVVFIYHLIINYLWHQKKAFARGYIKLYVWVAGPLCTLSGLLNLKSAFFEALFFLFAGALFLFVAFGLSQFPEKESRKKIAG